MVDAVGIEPTTCGLSAVRTVLAPAATGYYKSLSFVRISRSILPANRYLYASDYARF